MQKSLISILRDNLIGKKIKLYSIFDDRSNTSYYITDLLDLPHPKKCRLTGESSGTIESIEVEHDNYEGDMYNFIILDVLGVPIHFNGLNSITSNLTLL